MEEEEVDYMSDTFLPSSTSQDVRPGLLHNRVQQRTHNIHKKRVQCDQKNKELYKPMKQREAEARNEGLEKTLDESNKGFAMLQKMGYKTGQALGKSGEGRLDPIEISLKNDRQGLGRESLLRDIAEKKALAKKRLTENRTASVNVDEFRKRMTQKVQERQFESDLRKSQRICKELDEKKDVNEPIEKWFWPIIEKPADEDDSEAEDEEEEDSYLETSEKLEIITRYLREEHIYCIWCGAVYDDEKDLKDNCPGTTRDDH